ncbi:MAG: SPOR domain-containing protein, partial [Magnetococcales bacterium]|nr:SPOR domain-containing protein [Magnetococcales bacterium]
RFATLVGFPPPGLLAPPLIDKKRLPTTRGEALEIAMNRHPALLAAKADLDATRAESKASAASLWPKISLDMALSDSANSGGTRSYSQDASAMLRFKYNLFRGGADTAKFKESTFKSARFRDKMEEVRLQIEEKVNRAWNALLGARARLQSLEKHLATTRAVNRDHQEQHRLGSETLLDLLNSEHELQAAGRLLIEEEFLFLMESFRLLGAMGLLKETLVPAESPLAPLPALSEAPSVKADASASASLSGSAVPVTPQTPAVLPSAPERKTGPGLPRKTTSQSRPTTTPDAPPTSAQNEAIDGLIDALFQSESETTRMTPAPTTPASPGTPIPATSLPAPPETAREARTALAATLQSPPKPSRSALTHAFDALAKTVRDSSEQNPAPPANPTEESDSARDTLDLQELERIPLQEFIHLMTDDETRPAASKPTPDLLQYTIQIGAFRDEASAIRLIGQLQDKGYDFYLQELRDASDRLWYQVSIGRLENERQARAVLKQFTEQEGRPAFITPVSRKGVSTVSDAAMPFNPPPASREPDNAPPTSRAEEGYAVQVAAFQNPTETEKKLIELSSRGYDLYLCETKDGNGRNWQLIWIGRYPTQEQARQAAEEYFKTVGEAAQVIEVRPTTPEDPQVITRIGSPA